MVLLGPRSPRALARTSAIVLRLGRAGLAGHAHGAEAQLTVAETGAAHVGHGLHAVAQHLQQGGIKRQVGESRARRLFNPADRLDQTRRHRLLTIGDAGRIDGQLQGVDVQRALPDPIAGRLARIPFSVAAHRIPAPPLAVRHQPGLLTGQADVEGLTKAHFARRLGDRVRSELGRDGHEIDVARGLDGPAQVQRPMPSQTGETPAQEEAAIADHATIGVPAPLHGRETDDRLERRAWSEGAAQRLVQQRPPLIVGQGAIDLGRHARNEQVGIKRWRRDHGQDVAVAHVHDDAAAGLLAEHFQGPVLDVVVQGQHDLGALDGRL
ncbi:hypothetical protein D3C87_1268110 [compost metagenome]